MNELLRPKHERLGSIFSECDIFQEPIQSHLGAHLGQSILSQLDQLRSYREDFSFNLFIMRAVILCGEGVHPARKHFVFINRKRVVGHIRHQPPRSQLNNRGEAIAKPIRQKPTNSKTASVSGATSKSATLNNKPRATITCATLSVLQMLKAPSQALSRGVVGGLYPPTTMPGVIQRSCYAVVLAEMRAMHMP
jgi:hypothetical protein